MKLLVMAKSQADVNEFTAHISPIDDPNVYVYAEVADDLQPHTFDGVIYLTNWEFLPRDDEFFAVMTERTRVRGRVKGALTI
jgi:hypothetical protein